MTTAPTENRPGSWDRAALSTAIVIGAGVTIFTLVSAVMRVIEVLRNVDVPVTAAFADTPATLPIGPGGAPVEIVASEVIIRVSGMPPITLVSLVLAEVVSALAIVVTVVAVCFVIRNIIRGQAFGRANVGLVGIATLAIAFGWLLTWLFSTMGANGAATALAGEAGANSAFEFVPVQIFAIAALGALSSAFVIGNRLQTETEGLV